MDDGNLNTYRVIGGLAYRAALGKIITILFIVLFIAVSSAVCWRFPWQSETSSAAKSTLRTNIAGIFFDEQYGQQGFSYAYPKTSSTVEISKKNVKNGRASLYFNLEVDSFSGGSVCLHDTYFNLRPYIKKGAVQFWIKGMEGGEKAWVALVDEAESDDRKTVVRIDINWFGKITSDWSFISIPLEHFGIQGVYWNAGEGREIDAPFDWNRVAEFRIESRKDENTAFRVWIDDIVIVKSLR